MGGTNGGETGGWARGQTVYELSNHLGNVLVTINDKRKGIDVGSNGFIDYYEAIVLTANDYYPFGMRMPGRRYVQITGMGYRYGFNTQEKNRELGEDIYTAEYWEYDSRIGRRWNMDPDVFDGESPYAVNRNNPIIFTDPDGDWPIFGFIVGFVTEFVIQTVEIALKVRKSYDVGEMVVSGVATQAGMGITKQINRIKSLSKLGKEVLQLGADVAVNAAEQYVTEGKIDIFSAGINAGFAKIGGDLLDPYFRKTSTYKSLDRLATKSEDLISDGYARTSRKIKAKMAREAAEGYVERQVLARTIPATSVPTRVIQIATASENKEKQNNEAPETNPFLKNTPIPLDPFKATPNTTPLNVKGLKAYLGRVEKKYSSQIANISTNPIDQSSAGITITWKNGTVSAFCYDSRFKEPRMPDPPTSNP